MADVSLDAQLPDAAALPTQQQAMRIGHCDLLPERQIAPMTRIQIARDRAMAQAVVKAPRAGQDRGAAGRRRPRATGSWACRSTCPTDVR